MNRPPPLWCLLTPPAAALLQSHWCAQHHRLLARPLQSFGGWPSQLQRLSTCTLPDGRQAGRQAGTEAVSQPCTCAAQSPAWRALCPCMCQCSCSCCAGHSAPVACRPPHEGSFSIDLMRRASRPHFSCCDKASGCSQNCAAAALGATAAVLLTCKAGGFHGGLYLLCRATRGPCHQATSPSLTAQPYPSSLARSHTHTGEPPDRVPVSSSLLSLWQLKGPSGQGCKRDRLAYWYGKVVEFSTV
jgi:hypothetical protein